MPSELAVRVLAVPDLHAQPKEGEGDLLVEIRLPRDDEISLEACQDQVSQGLFHDGHFGHWVVRAERTITAVGASHDWSVITGFVMEHADAVGNAVVGALAKALIDRLLALRKPSPERKDGRRLSLDEAQAYAERHMLWTHRREDVKPVLERGAPQKGGGFEFTFTLEPLRRVTLTLSSDGSVTQYLPAREEDEAIARANGKPPFSEVWRRIEALEGEQFATKTGKPFTYSVEGNGLSPSVTNHRISRADIEAAYDLAPMPGPGTINKVVRGPAYVWSILHDSRIKSGQW